MCRDVSFLQSRDTDAHARCHGLYCSGGCVVDCFDILAIGVDTVLLSFLQSDGSLLSKLPSSYWSSRTVFARIECLSVMDVGCARIMMVWYTMSIIGSRAQQLLAVPVHESLLCFDGALLLILPNLPQANLLEESSIGYHLLFT